MSEHGEPGVIRPARTDEAALLHALTARSTMYWGYEPAFLDWEPEAIAVSEELVERAAACALLEEAARVTGYYLLLAKDGELWLDKLFVEPDLIGTGRGKRLWRHAVDAARSLGALEIRFYADPNAAPFYRAMGATWEESIPMDWPGWELQVFRMTLAAPSDNPPRNEPSEPEA